MFSSDTNQALQPQKMARGLRIWFKEVEGLYYLCSENKGADQLPSYCTADLPLLLTNAKIRFSHDMDHFVLKDVLHDA